MLLQGLSTNGYRNLAAGEIHFSDGINLLYGQNAAGKTNTLECIYLFASGRSFRTRKETDFIRRGEPTAEASIRFCRACAQSANRSEPLVESMSLCWKKDSGQKLTKKMLYQGCETPRASEFLGIFRAVLFTPDHLSLIKGSPEERRRFTDIALSQLAPRYVRCMNDYLKILSQKNAYLKKTALTHPDEAYLDVLDTQLASAGAVLLRQRSAFVSHIQVHAAHFYTALTDSRERLEIKYLSSGLRGVSVSDNTEETESRLLSVFRADRASDMRFGRSLHGPHKDDLAVFIADRLTDDERRRLEAGGTDEAGSGEPNAESESIALSDFAARTFASQGQQRSAVLALKLAEGELFKELTGEYPVFLFDDLFGELDEFRRARLLKLLDGRQVIISACDRSSLSEKAHLLHVADGHITCPSDAGKGAV